MAFATNIYSSYLSWLGLQREAVPGTAVAPVITLPADASTYAPVDQPVWLDDTALRGSNAYLYNVIQGVELASWEVGGPFYFDVHGYFLDNMFGDRTDSAATTTSATTLTAPLAAGATSATLTSAGTFVTGGYMQVGAATITTTPQIVGPITVAGTSVTWTNPTRFAIATATPAAAFIAAGSIGTNLVTHTFSSFNAGTGQPPTTSLTDYTGITSTHGARVYAGTCVAKFDLTVSAEGIVSVKLSASSVASTPSATAVVNTPTAVIPIPSWVGTVQLNTGSGYSAITDFAEVTYSFSRKLKAYYTEDGSQTPLVIARGPLMTSGGVNYDPAVDETGLTNMLTNLQPGMQLTLNNATTVPSPANASNIVIQTSKTAFKTSKIQRKDILIGYDTTFDAVSNVTDAGATGGFSPAKVTLANYYPTY